METYILPVKFTEEERAAYARWGLKKAKTLIPLALVVIAIDLFLTIALIMYLLGMYQVDYWKYQMLMWHAEGLLEVRYVVVLILSGIFLKAADLIFNLINGRPPKEKRLRATLQEEGIILCLEELKGQKENGMILAQERKNWQELDFLFAEVENAVWMDGQKVVIGENTIETIYPVDARKPWLDRPGRRPRDIVSVGQLHRIAVGYLAGQKAREQEARFLRENP